MNIYLSAILHIKENSIPEALEIMKKVVIETRKEKGCIRYDLIEDIRNKGIFFIHETWETNDDLQKHQISEHLADFRKNISSLQEKPNMVFVGNKLF